MEKHKLILLGILSLFLIPIISAYPVCQDSMNLNSMPCMIQTNPVTCGNNATIYDLENSLSYIAEMSLISPSCTENCIYQFLFTLNNTGNYFVVLCDGSYAEMIISDSSSSIESPVSFTSIKEVFNPYSYPYVDVSTIFTMSFKLLSNGVSTDVGNVNISINGTDLPFSWGGSQYTLSVNISNAGDYPFTIHSLNSSVQNFSGIFLVRSPYYTTVCGFKENGDKYLNKNAYITAEFVNSDKYDATMEHFLTPFSLGVLGFPTTFKKSVFHAPYNNGCGVLKLYENSSYAVRLMDGEMNFQTTFSPPNVTKSYGVNIYFGNFNIDSIKNSFKIILLAKDLNQYGWLFNWSAIIILIVSLLVSISLFFILPEYPFISLVFFILTVGGTIIARVIIWFYLG